MQEEDFLKWIQDFKAVKEPVGDDIPGGGRLVCDGCWLFIRTRGVRIVSLKEILWKFKGSLQDQRREALGSEREYEFGAGF